MKPTVPGEPYLETKPYRRKLLQSPFTGRPVLRNRFRGIMHWTGAAGVLGCVGTVKAAQNSDKDSSVLGIGKGTWMYATR